MPPLIAACCRQAEHKQQGKPGILPPASGALWLCDIPVQRWHPEFVLASLWQTSLWISYLFWVPVFIYFWLPQHPVTMVPQDNFVWHEKLLPIDSNFQLDHFIWYPSAPLLREIVNICSQFIALPFNGGYSQLHGSLSQLHWLGAAYFFLGTETVSLESLFSLTLTFPISINSFPKRETNRCIKRTKFDHTYWFTKT